MSPRGLALAALLAGCTPRSDVVPLPELPDSRTTLLVYRLDDGADWRGWVLDPEAVEWRVPKKAKDVAVVGYLAGPAALGVEPGDEIGPGPREAPVPDLQRRRTADWYNRLLDEPESVPVVPVGEAWVVESPALRVDLPACPIALPSGYCQRASCEAGTHDRGDGVCWPVGRCLDGRETERGACRRCGDGVVDAPETCDDGGTEAGDGCSATCAKECGDGVLTLGEACDDGAPAAAHCRGCEPELGFECLGRDSRCTPICGNGRRSEGEACDDGNEAGGDGCSPSCEVEDGWKCGGGGACTPDRCGDRVVDAGEECDPPGDRRGCVGCRVGAGWWCPPQEACQAGTVALSSLDFGRSFAPPKPMIARLENPGEPIAIEARSVTGTASFAVGAGCEVGATLPRAGSCAMEVVHHPATTKDEGALELTYRRGGGIGRVRATLGGRAWCASLGALEGPIVAIAATSTTTLAFAERRAAGDRLGWLDDTSVLDWQTFDTTAIAGLAAEGPDRVCAAGSKGGPAQVFASCLSLTPDGSTNPITLAAELPGAATGLAVGPDRRLLVGWTGPGFPDAPEGEPSPFVLALDPDLSVRHRRVGLGPVAGERPLAVAVDAAGDVHVVGTVGPADRSDLFWARLSPSLELRASTSTGTGRADGATHVVAHDCGLFIAGWTDGNPSAGPKPGGRDVVVARLDPATGARTWTTLLGTRGDDRAVGLAVEASGVVRVAMATDGASRGVVVGLGSRDGAGIAATDEELPVDGSPTALAVDADGRRFVAGEETTARDLSVCRNGGGGFLAHLGRTPRPACSR